MPFTRPRHYYAFSNITFLMPEVNVVYENQGLRIWIRNDKDKEYKPFFQIFVRREILGHDDNWSARVRATIGTVHFETIHQYTKMNTPGVPYKFWIKMVQSFPSLAIRRMQHNVGLFTITFSFLMPPQSLHCFLG
jgi:hypothetical protein